jgi:hypothetical protein
MASSRSPFRPDAPRRQVELPKLSFDPSRVTLTQLAIVGFLIGVFFHACVALAVLDDGSSASTDGSPGVVVSSVPTALPGAVITPTPLPDRTSCDQIRGTEYRSEAERQWFQRNCT